MGNPHKNPTAPNISYQEAVRGWFIYAGNVHSVALCSEETFTAFITRLINSVVPRGQCQKAAMFEARYALAMSRHKSNEDERLLTRWFILDCLCEVRNAGLHLHPSKQEALKGARSLAHAG